MVVTLRGIRVTFSIPMSNQGLGSPCNSNVILQTSCENRKAYLQRGGL